ncbi:MAG: sigma-54-dependent Fis family transcriptional regulator [Candidatus Lindowbacteria bacterium]|nr:sigma-54-dependent Fis family transcriptional regulator [Candidatus Lindowbacteria bacterium]
MIADVRLPGIDGIELMRLLRERNETTETIIITGHGDIPLAVKAMKEGAVDFITKPFPQIGDVVLAVARALEKSKPGDYADVMTPHGQKVDRFESLVGASPVMQKVYERIAQVAPTDSTVLIRGETGTGKELVACAIHARSRRSNGPFIAVNCGALTESLLESELFGHLKGAFTGALMTKIGLFEAASGGTIFLDEIDSTSPHTQVGLLRVLQDKQVRPVGSVSTKKVNVRIIASTQKDLFELTQESKFREDLYYRVSSISIMLPPLRERMEDLPLLAEHCLKIACEKASKQRRGLSPKVLELLMSHSWPGNVRELENVIEQAVLFSQRPVIRPTDLGALVEKEKTAQTNQQLKTLDDLEREHILQVLKFTCKNKTQAAKILGIPRTTLYQRMKKHHISADSEEEEFANEIRPR